MRNPYSVLAARLSPAELPVPPARPARLPWCGECAQATRMLGFDGATPRPYLPLKAGRHPQPRESATPSGLSPGRSTCATARTAVTERESRSLACQPKFALNTE